MVAIESNPADRFATAAEFARALSDPRFRRSGASASSATSGRWRVVAMVGWAAAIVFAAAAVTTALRRANSEAPPVSFEIAPTPNVSFGEFNADPYPAVSPDGRMIAFIANTLTNKNQLFVRQVTAAAPVALERIVNAQWPFWSHDGRHIGYFAEGKLRRVPVAGGPAVDIATLAGFGGTWNASGDILVGTDEGIVRVPAEGGAPERITTLDSAKGDRSHRYPQFLPDGRGFVFLAIGSREERAGIMRATLGDTATRRLIPDVGNAIVASSDELLFVRGASLMAQRFDRGWHTPAGDPVQVADGLQVPSGTIRYSPFAAAGGTLAYRGAQQPPTQLSIVDRGGTPLSTLGISGSFIAPAWSPDGSRVVVSRWDRNTGGLNLWMVDVARDAATPVTTGQWFNSHPVWSGDSRRLLFSSTRSGQFRIHEALLTTGGDSVLVSRPGARVIPHSWSRDGKTLFYSLEDGTGPETDIWQRTLDSGTDRVLAESDADESQGRVSPDGKFIAYGSDASGHWEVYIRSLDGSAISTRVSPRGGTNPAWRGDGKELYYLEPDERTRTEAVVSGWIMAVPVNLTSARLVSTPERLFQARWSNYLLNELWVFQPDAKGERFVINTVIDAAPSPLTVVMGWPRLLEAREAAKP
jgi:Tol biopolymer transport system component